MASSSGDGPASRLRSSKGKTQAEAPSSSSASRVLAESGEAMKVAGDIKDLVKAMGFTDVDIEDLIKAVERGADLEEFLGVFNYAMRFFSTKTEHSSVYKAELGMRFYNELQAGSQVKHNTARKSTSTSENTQQVQALSLALSKFSVGASEKGSSTIFSYQQWGTQAFQIPVARDHFPPRASVSQTKAVWPYWGAAVTAGKTSKFAKEIKATVGAKSKSGPRSETKLKYSLLKQEERTLEGVVSVFIPGFQGPCETKTPDFFLVEKGHKNCSTSETIGALLYAQSTSDSSSYSARAQVGEVVVAGRVFLTQSSEDRHFVYVGITDLRRIWWFKVQRQYRTTHQSPEISDVDRSLAGFMYCSLSELGIMCREISVGATVIEIGRWLGGGLTSNVYLAKVCNQEYAVKIAKAGHDMSADITNLSKLRGVQGILRIDRAKSDKKKVCMQPVCEKVDRMVLRERNMRPCLANLVDTLLCAHTRGLVNRDVREENIMISEEELVIVDWGFAVPVGTSHPFEGTTRYASERVLTLLQNGVPSFEVKPSDDLVSLVRTLFGIFEMSKPDSVHLNSLPSSAYADINAFWQLAISKNPIYKAAHKLASEGKYGELKTCLLTFVQVL